MGTHTLNMEQTFSKSELVDGSKMNVSAVELWPTSAVQAVEMEIKSPLISSSKEYDYSSFSLYKETESKSNLSAGTIAGIVLGTIAGIILFLGSIILLIFAKATERWCFADDDYQYERHTALYPTWRSRSRRQRQSREQLVQTQ